MGVRGYLIDDNHVTAWSVEQAAFMGRLRQKPPQWLIFVSTVTLGEIEWGQLVTTSTDQERRRRYKEFVARELWQFVLPVTPTVSFAYAEILDRIWRKNPPSTKSTRTEAHIVSLGVDINDLWLVATAKERNLTVLTQDRMAKIREVVPEVAFECWV